MFDRGAITIKIKSDISSLASGLKQATRNVQDFVGNTRKAFATLEQNTRGAREAFGSITKTITNTAGAAFDLAKTLTIGVVGAFTAVSAYGLKMGDSIQQTAIAFDTMLGNADERRKLMSDITDFAKNTPFERFELIDSSKLLLAMGVSADKIIPSMQMLGDISAGVSANVKDVAFVFGQVKAQGQAYTQDLNQFAARGIPVYEEVAKVLGISVAQLRDGMGSNKIKVNFDTLNTAFQNLTKEGGKFNNLMALQSRSLGGILSNLKDGFDNLVLTFMGITSQGDVRQGSFFDIATQKAAGFQQWLANNEATIGEWGGRVFGAIAQGIDKAWSDYIAPALRHFKDWFDSGGKEAIKTFLTEAWSKLQTAFDNFMLNTWPKIEPMLQQFSDYMTSPQFQSDLVKVADLIGKIADAALRLADAAADAAAEQNKIISEAGGDRNAMFNPINQMKVGWKGWQNLISGNRANGGPVDKNSMYEVGEYNRPELLKVKGRQYLIPGNNGRILNQNQIKNESNNTSNKTVNIYQYGSNLETVFTSAPLLAA